MPQFDHHECQLCAKCLLLLFVSIMSAILTTSFRTITSWVGPNCRFTRHFHTLSNSWAFHVQKTKHKQKYITTTKPKTKQKHTKSHTKTNQKSIQTTKPNQTTPNHQPTNQPTNQQTNKQTKTGLKQSVSVFLCGASLHHDAANCFNCRLDQEWQPAIA